MISPKVEIDVHIDEDFASLDILYTHYYISKSGTLIWIPFKNIFSIIWKIQPWKLNDINNQWPAVNFCILHFKPICCCEWKFKKLNDTCLIQHYRPLQDSFVIILWVNQARMRCTALYINLTYNFRRNCTILLNQAIACTYYEINIYVRRNMYVH